QLHTGRIEDVLHPPDDDPQLGDDPVPYFSHRDPRSAGYYPGGAVPAIACFGARLPGSATSALRRKNAGEARHCRTRATSPSKVKMIAMPRGAETPRSACFPGSM